MKITCTPEAFKILHEGSKALARVEATGVRVDKEYLDQACLNVDKEILEKMASLREDPIYDRWRRRYGDNTNLGSHDQLAEVLFNVMGYPCQEWTSGGSSGKRRPKADEVALTRLDLPFVQDYLRVEKLKKARGTYLEGIRRELVFHDGMWFVHPSYNLHTASSIRSSCDSPNWQNVPARIAWLAEIIRRCYVPRFDRFGEIDESGIEVRVAACVVGSTRIETIEGGQTIIEVIRRVQNGEQIHVYGYSREKGRICIGRVTEGGLTRRRVKVLKVTLDNGACVTATPDHKFMLRDGSYICLSDLKPGDSLMPLYKRRRSSRCDISYEEIRLNNGKATDAHTLIALDVLGVDTRAEKLLVHHNDGDGTNNALSNLQVMTRGEHIRVHRLGTKHSSETKARISQARKGINTGGGWNRGLTKETDKRVARISLGRVGQPAWNKGKVLPSLTTDHKDKIAKSLQGRDMTSEHKRRLSENKSEYWSRIRANQTKVRCPVCGKQFLALSSHMVRKHQVTPSEYREGNNHKVVFVEPAGYEDVYNITVEGAGNYAVSAGVIIKNCYNRDPNLIRYIEDPSTDMHRDTASDLFFLPVDYLIRNKDWAKRTVRDWSKNRMVFPQFYGSVWFQCAPHLWEAVEQAHTRNDKIPEHDVTLKTYLKSKGIKGLGSCEPTDKPAPGTFARQVMDVERIMWDKRFPVYTAWKKKAWQEYQDTGSFSMFSGFTISALHKRNDVLNYRIQGFAFHIVLWSLIQLDKWLRRNKMRSVIVGEIHDSLALDMVESEMDDVLHQAQQIMTVDVRKHWPKIIVPLEVEAEVAPRGQSWHHKVKYPLSKLAGGGLLLTYACPRSS